MSVLYEKDRRYPTAVDPYDIGHFSVEGPAVVLEVID